MFIKANLKEQSLYYAKFQSPQRRGSGCNTHRTGHYPATTMPLKG